MQNDALIHREGLQGLTQKDSFPISITRLFSLLIDIPYWMWIIISRVDYG